MSSKRPYSPPPNPQTSPRIPHEVKARRKLRQLHLLPPKTAKNNGRPTEDACFKALENPKIPPSPAQTDPHVGFFSTSNSSPVTAKARLELDDAVREGQPPMGSEGRCAFWFRLLTSKGLWANRLFRALSKIGIAALPTDSC